MKEEIIDDDAHLPCFNGRVVSWVSTGEIVTVLIGCGSIWGSVVLIMKFETKELY